ncbi:hypothetical protein [Paraburkholderia sp. BR14374]|uniref:hypothetical protein n=1 Tax=Paraburkholderia sp. BR14374 TaxID=3237007 RepID=UPI0034CE3BE4
MSLRIDLRRLHRSRTCAAGLQAAGSTVESKEPNILANYLRAKPGFDECIEFSLHSARFVGHFRVVLAQQAWFVSASVSGFQRSRLCLSTYSADAPMLIS